MTHARLITFEGGEGSGKSTQIKILHDYLLSLGKTVACFREPGSTSVSEQIRNILLHTEADLSPRTELFLYCAARSQLIHERLAPAMAAHDFVLVDRYTDSTLVYQGVALGLGIEAIAPIVTYGCSGFVPDKTFFLDIDPAQGLSRITQAKDRIEQRDIAFHQRLREGYHTLARMYPARMTVIYNDDIATTAATVKVTVAGMMHGC
jgi:dTMP kinase